MAASFIDKARIFCRAGKGGNGAVALRRLCRIALSPCIAPEIVAQRMHAVFVFTHAACADQLSVILAVKPEFQHIRCDRRDPRACILDAFMQRIRHIPAHLRVAGPDKDRRRVFLCDRPEHQPLCFNSPVFHESSFPQRMFPDFRIVLLIIPRAVGIRSLPDLFLSDLFGDGLFQPGSFLCEFLRIGCKVLVAQQQDIARLLFAQERFIGIRDIFGGEPVYALAAA